MHHVDDEEEAAAFINDKVKLTTAFLMDVDSDETEQDCTALVGTTLLHELRYVFSLPPELHSNVSSIQDTLAKKGRSTGDNTFVSVPVAWQKITTTASMLILMGFNSSGTSCERKEHEFQREELGEEWIEKRKIKMRKWWIVFLGVESSTAEESRFISMRCCMQVERNQCG